MKKIYITILLLTVFSSTHVFSQIISEPSISWSLGSIPAFAFFPMGGNVTYDENQLSTYIAGIGLDFFKVNPNPYRGTSLLNFSVYFIGLNYNSLFSDSKAKFFNWGYARVGPKYNTKFLGLDIGTQIGYAFVLIGKTSEASTSYQHGFDVGFTINLTSESIPKQNCSFRLEHLDRLEIDEGKFQLVTGLCPTLAGKKAILTLDFSCNLLKAEAAFKTKPTFHARTILISFVDENHGFHEEITTEYEAKYSSVEANISNGLCYDKKLDVNLKTIVDINTDGRFIAFIVGKTLRWGDPPTAKLLIRENAFVKVEQID